MAQLTCTDLSLGYEGRLLVENLNFSVNAGDYLCIIGENGSGKTTLMRTLLGLHAPMGGTIKMDEGLDHKKLGYLPQQTLVQRDFPASVEEIVLSGCQSKCGLRPFYTKAHRALAQKAMERMSITDFRKRCYRELSGGQQQRVLLARALCATGSLLILDEPVAGLDPKITQDMYRLIHRLNREDGITVIMVSHDIHAALEYASHILYIGKKTFFGTTAAYLESDLARQFILPQGGETA